jgi:beta-glucanase (GH16 family)
MNKILTASLSLLGLALVAVPNLRAATTTLLDLNFNDTNSTYPAWGSTALTGSPGDGVSTLRPTTTNSGLFPTAPTNGYLVLAPNAALVNSNTYFGGWAANSTVATVNSPYTAGGFGQTNLAKISLTARVRARGMPTNGAVVILKLHAAGDNPAAVTSGYKRVMFEPILLTNNDWTTIGGTIDNAAMTNTTAQGTRYNFLTNAASYQVLVELSGFNRFGTAGYYAYGTSSNAPTLAAPGGRKNPGFDLSASNIRVEVDDVRLVITDPATNGFAPSTTPAQLLRNPNFDLGDGNWSFFEGAYMSTDGWGEGGNANVAIIPGFSGLPYAGFMQNQIAFNATNGSFFTLTFRGKFEPNYNAGQTLVTFMNGNDTQNFKAVDINDQVAANLGQWATYAVRFNASTNDLAAMNGNMSVKIQPLERTVGSQQASALIDNLVLAQQSAAAVGPQLTVKVGGVSATNAATAALFPPLIGYSTPYPIVLQNDGAQTLTVSSVALSGTSFVWSGGSTASLQPGESRTFIATAAPSSNSPLTGTLTVLSNDKEPADQTFVVNLQTTPVTASDDFNSGTASSLGWVPFYDASTTTFDTNASVTVGSGALNLNVDSQNGAGLYPWYYGAKKVFASPGSVDLVRSSLATSLRAFGKYFASPSNKVQVYLESLSSSGAPTGRVSLGQWVDETTAGAEPGLGSYFTPDGTNDRVAVLLPEGGGYTSVQSALSSAISQGFNPNAPAFQVVVRMTDFEFDLDTGNIVALDSLGLNLVTKPFEVANGGFESDNSDFAAPLPPTSWLQYPVDGVSKNLMTNGTAVYNATTGMEDAGTPFAAYVGTKSMKIYAQNFYSGGIWVGPSQTGVVYQEWPLAGTAGLSTGQAIHARGAAKVYGIDALTGGSTFKYGFRYMDAANVVVGSDEVTTITASTDVPDKWVPLVANGTIPAGAAKVQLIAEFVQNNSTDRGAVYLDDLSVGLGLVPATQVVGAQTYQLSWSDEFDGSSLNSGNWTPETGGGGWGNNEVQTYTTNSENLRVESGNLIIQAVKSSGSWTSARIKTQDKRGFKYGKIEFRAKLPTGVGPWPAAWMMGTNISSVGWPNCGEIDVMEWRGFPTNEANTVGHALHSPTRNGGNPVEPPSRSAVTNPSTEFHTYAVVWTSNNMTFSVDGVDKATLTPPVADAAVFREQFFLLLNLAIGGNYVSNQIDPALTNAVYQLDYVRVYQDPAANGVPADTTPPVFTFNGSASVTHPWGSVYSDAGATAFDAGDNSAVSVVTNNPVNPSVPGTYQILYTAADSKTNIAMTNRAVTVAMANGGTNVGADGMSDAMRYAMGGTGPQPLSKDLLPTNSLVTGTNGKSLVITYHARTNNNVSLFPVASTNVGSTNVWTTNGITVQTLGTVPTNGTVLEKRQATSPASTSKIFLKLRSILVP